MIRVFRKEKPDIVHSTSPKAGLLSMIAAKICGVPTRINTFTGLIFPTSTGLKKQILILTDKLTCACATHIIPEGEGVKSDLEKNKITKKPLKVLGHGNIKGIDLIYFDPNLPDVKAKAEKIRKDGVFTFVFIGRLVRDKGINELIKAFKTLNKIHPTTRLILVGGFEQKLDPLDPETISEINNNPAIEAVGVQRDVRPWLLASDCFVFPSYREGFPNVVIEAGAMELPSIVTDINGSREIISHGKNGLIIPSRDGFALLTAMERFLKESELAQELSRNARTMVADRFEQSFVHRCQRDYYKDLILKRNNVQTIS